MTTNLPPSEKELTADRHWEAFIDSAQNALPTTDPSELELMLWRALRGVQFIGELPLKKQHAQQLAIILQRGYPTVSHNAFRERYFANPRPALLMVTMVLTARHFQGNVAKFWEYFLVNMLGVSADQNWQNALRSCYRDSLSWLITHHPQLWQPIDDRQVVRAIYSHAVIPQYVEDDFARLVLYWRENRLHTWPVESILTQTPTTYLNVQAEPLRKFLKDDDYADARRMLIDSVLAALQLHDEIGDTDAVRDLLSNPIQRAIWMHIENELKRLIVARAVARKPSSPYWVWDVVGEELMMALPTQKLAKKTHPKPEYVITVDDGQPARQQIYPWDDGLNWITDPLRLPFAPSDSLIILNDRLGRAVHRMTVPPLPASDFTLYRPDASGETARVVTDSTRGLPDGEYWVSHVSGIELTDAQQERIRPIEPLHVPRVLRQQNNHTQGGRYHLRFPVSVMTGDGRMLEKLTHPAQTAPKITLSGDLIDLTLSADKPQIFRSVAALHAEVYAPAHCGKQFTALIRLEKDHRTFHFTVPDDGFLSFMLEEHMPDTFGTFELQLYAGTRAVGEAQIFAVVPDIEIEGPSLEIVYSPTILPKAVAIGTVQHYEAQLTGAGAIKASDIALDIEWHELRDTEVGFILSKDDRYVEFRWKVRRVWAWLENVKDSPDRVSLSELNQAVVIVRGAGNAWAVWRVGERAYQFQLNARGEYRNDVRLDSLGELLRYSQEDCHVVLSFGNIQWSLFQFAAMPALSSDRITQVAETPVMPPAQPVSEFEMLTQLLRPYRKELARERFPPEYMAQVLSAPDKIFKQLEMPVLLGDAHMARIYRAVGSREGIGALDENGVLAFVIDREYTRQILSGEKPVLLEAINQDVAPTARRGYCYAVMEYVKNMQDPQRHKARSLIDRLVSRSGISYEVADWFWTRIDIPMIERANQVWQILHAREDDNVLMRLDRRVFLIALGLRLHAHYPDEAKELFDVAGLELKSFIRAFGWAARGCHRLMAWAIGWAEICHHYQSLDDAEGEAS